MYWRFTGIAVWYAGEGFKSKNAGKDINTGRFRMDTKILENIPFKVDLDELMQRLKIDDDDDRHVVMSLLEKAESIGMPKAVYGETFIESREEDVVVLEGISFRSRILSVNLEKVHRVFPYIVTSGTELEEWSASLEDMLESYWADTIKEMILYSAIEYFLKYISENYPIGKISVMNPGSLEDWPLKEQEGLFKLLGDPYRHIGVRLTDSCLMLPVKSVSGIIFPSEADYFNCQLCGRQNCPNRKVPLDSELYEKKYR
jgi:hypothetical protein